MNFRKIYFVLLSAVVLALLVSCGQPVLEKQLVKSDFQLVFPENAPENLHQTVIDLEMDSRGNFYVTDLNAYIVKYDAIGRFEKNLVHQFTAEKLIGISAADSGYLMYEAGIISQYSQNWELIHQTHSESLADITYSPNGKTILMNRSGLAGMYDYVLQTYIDVPDTNRLKLVKLIRPARAEIEEDSYLDYGFSDFISDSRILYTQVYSDSAFIYDMAGNLKRARKLKSTVEPLKQNDTGIPYHFDDMAVTDDAFYLARVDQAASVQDTMYINLVEKYDFDLNLVAAYKLPVPITMSIPLEQWAISYRKFQVYNDRFYFFVSQPQEHLEVYDAE